MYSVRIAKLTLSSWLDKTYRLFCEQFTYFSKLYLFLGFRTSANENNYVERKDLTCQFTTARISCPEHSTIKIMEAVYGFWEEKKQCRTIWCPGCGSHIDGKKAMSQQCNGKQNCQFEVSNDFFGRNPTDQRKYVEYTYRCYCTNQHNVMSGNMHNAYHNFSLVWYFSFNSYLGGICHCKNELFDVEKCDQCANPKHKVTTDCKECIDPLTGYPACDSCLPNYYDYPNCKGESWKFLCYDREDAFVSFFCFSVQFDSILFLRRSVEAQLLFGHSKLGSCETTHIFFDSSDLYYS